MGYPLMSGLPVFIPGHRPLVQLQIRRMFAYDLLMFDPDAGVPRLNRSLVNFGASIIAGLRLARQSQVSVRVLPTIHATEESIDLSHEIFYRIFRKVPQRMKGE